MAKKMKTIIIKAPKPRKFDLSFIRPAENARILSAIESLKQNQGWYLLVQTQEREIELIEKSIIGKTENGTTLSDADIDLLRVKRGYLLDLIQMPDKLTAQLTIAPTEPYDPDPYSKEVKLK